MLKDGKNTNHTLKNMQNLFCTNFVGKKSQFILNLQNRKKQTDKFTFKLYCSIPLHVAHLK